MKHAPVILGALAILLTGFAFRGLGRDWDDGHLLHPDERHMGMVTVAVQAPQGLTDRWNGATSGFTPYNRGIHSYVYGQLPLQIVHGLTVAQGRNDLQDIIRVGRTTSAVFSTATLLLLVLLGWRLHSPRAGLLAAGLQALVVLSIQLAHFYTVDSFGTFFATACVGTGLLYAKEQRLPWLILSGALVGLAMACRINLGLLALWVTAIACMSAWNKRSVHPFTGLVSGGFIALLLFRFFQPMAFDGWGLNPRWLQDLTTVNHISRGTMEVPFTLQWVGRIPYLYALTQFGTYSLGLPLGLAVFISLGLFLFRSPSRFTDWRFAAALWPLLLFAYHGRIFLHTQRYFDPVIPICVLCASVFLWSVKPLRWRRGLIGGVTVCTLWVALAFTHIYREPHTRIRASEWLIEQLPPGSTVLTEHWDDALPLRLDGPHGMNTPQLQVYHPETEAKLRRMVEQIGQADFLVLSSTRASLTLPRMPMRYPVMTRFYHTLQNNPEVLGLREAKRFETFPRFAGLHINSLKAEEAYRVYDHPLVRIYETTETFDPEDLYGMLTQGIDFATIPDIRYLQSGKSNAGWLTPEQLQRRRSGNPPRELFHPESLGAKSPVLIWTILVQALYVIGFPLSFFLFPSLRDRGFAVSRLLGLLVLAWMAWIPAALELLPFKTSLLLAGMISVGGSTALLVWKWEEMHGWFKQHGRRLVTGEMICWTVYALFFVLRMLDPELWHPWAGGEKPMDFAFLNATTLTEAFPPQNPWLSGAFVNYYYYGFVLVAVLIRLTGVPPEIAYNLALPTFAFFTAGVILSLTSALTPLFKHRRRTLVGVLAVVLTLCIGNLGQIREYLRPGFPGHPRDVYWNASRVIQVPPGEVHPITEFPLFSFLYADLHAHLMALPVAMLCLLISWQLFRRFHPLRIAGLSLALGTLWITNTWDLPIQAAVFAFAVLFPAWNDKRWRLRCTAVVGGLGLAYLLFAPFHLRFESMPLELKFWQGPRSHPLDLFLAHGLFLVPLLWGGHVWFWNETRTLTRYHLLPALLTLGCLFTIGFLEAFHIGGDIGRMNLVFKFYYQIWWILALLTALIFVRLAGARHLAYTCVCGALLACGLVYPFTAIPAKINEWGFPSPSGTLNGMAYLEQSTLDVDGTRIPLADDLEVIRWLRSNASPGSVLLEAQRPLYQWGGRISWHTGLPSVLGWDWHMRQQRPWPGGDKTVYQRKQDIDRFYREADPTILTRYHVDYVILGDLERVTYGEEALSRIQEMEHLTLVFRTNDTVVYKVTDMTGLR